MAINTNTFESTLQNKLDNVTDPKEMLLLGKAYESTVGGLAVTDIEDAGAAQVAEINNVATNTFKTVGGSSILGSGNIVTLPTVYTSIDKTERVTSFSSSGNTQFGSCSITLTPKSTASKFLIFFNPFYECGGPQHFRLRLMRNGVRQTTLENTGNSNYGVGFSNLAWDQDNNSTAHNTMTSVWDTPNTTSSITYTINGANHSGDQTVYINRYVGNYGSGVTQLIIFEYE